MYYSGMVNVLLCSLVIPEVTHSFFATIDVNTPVVICLALHIYLNTVLIQLPLCILFSSSQLKQLH